MKNNVGIVWLVDDKPEQCSRFYRSYRTACYHMPEVSKTVFYTSQPTGIDECEIFLETNYTSFAAKFDAWKASPYDNTLFLDNDTFVLKDLSKHIQKNKN